MGAYLLKALSTDMLILLSKFWNKKTKMTTGSSYKQTYGRGSTHSYWILYIKHSNILDQHVAIFSNAPNSHSHKTFLMKILKQSPHEEKML